MLLQSGTAVDRYDVEALLGEGGMAEVYRVRHRTLGSTHALKVLKLEVPGIRERLVQEGQLQATLRHANVVAVTDVVDIDGRPGLVMEYIAGPTLELWLRQHQPTLEETEELFLGILAGVARAHRIGLVHRDLKPGNVLLEETDEGVIPKVTDFGLAKVLVEQGGILRTRSGVPMGTPAYMAPEQVRDASNVDQRADIFALGAILYELVVGVPPFDAPDALTIFGRLARGEYQPPEALVPTLPERFRRAIKGCLAIEREDRIPDCSALRDLFVGQAELSDVSGVHVVALRGARPRTTVVNTLEPAGHGRPSGSDTFVADGVAGPGSSPTMAPPSMMEGVAETPPEAEGAHLAAHRLESAPGTTGGAAGGGGPARSSPPPGPGSSPGSAYPESGPGAGGGGARSWLFGLGALGMIGLVGASLVVVGLVVVFTREAPGPASHPRPHPPERPIPEVPAATVDAPVGPAAGTTTGMGDVGTAPEGVGAAASAGGSSAGGAAPDGEPKSGGAAGSTGGADAGRVGGSAAAGGGSTASAGAPGGNAAAGDGSAAPAGAPGGSAAPTGRFTVTGDADEVWLEQGGVRRDGADVPPGDYTVQARFKGETVPSGVVRIRAGETTTVRCSADFKLCRTK